MEWLPKFYDTVDSILFEWRLRWAGYVGQSVRDAVVVSAVLILCGVSPLFRQFTIAVIAAFMLAELAGRAARSRRSFATR